MTDAVNLKAFLARQRVLLSRERDAELERTTLLFSRCSHRLLEQKGLAIGGLGVVSVQVGLGGKNLIEVERPSAYHTTPIFPPHTFRPGDLARIEEHVPTTGVSARPVKKSGTDAGAGVASSALDGVVYKISDTRIVIAAHPSSSGDDLDIPERCRLLKLANTATFDRMDKTIDELERLVIPEASTSGSSSKSSIAGPNALHRVLLGISPLTMSPPPQNNTVAPLFFDRSLNVSQVHAVQFALRSPEVACIHGPPGTGKTRVLVEVIRQLVYAQLLASLRTDADRLDAPPSPVKILVCGASNLAVDNLLERLASPPAFPAPYPAPGPTEPSNVTTPRTSPHEKQALPPISLTRLGHPARVLPSLYARTLDAQAYASDEAELVRDVKSELEGLLAALSGRGSGARGTTSKTGRDAKAGPSTGSRGAKKGQRLRGEERKKAWQTVRDLRKEYRKRESGVVKTVLGQAQVVLATCHGAGSRQLEGYKFDVVIIDEATQAMEAACWIPILKGKKLILAGDPQQLGPTIISEGNRRHAKGKKDVTSNAAVSKQSRRGGPQSSGTGKPASSGVSKNSAPAEDEESDATSESSDSSSSAEHEITDTSSANRDKTTTERETKSTSRPLLRPPRSLNTTLFERLETMYNGKIKRMLTVQYRMNDKISEFPSRTLYHSRLKADKSNASRLLRDLPGVSQDPEYEDVVGEGSEVVFWDTAGAEFWERSGTDEGTDDVKLSLDDSGSLSNENEAAVLKRWVDRLINAGVRSCDIAIITPYQAQTQLLSALLPDPEFEIGTADGMQGREREAVVISLVRSNPEGDVGFLKDKRRLNVAMTRAKRHLCVIGDSSTIRRGGGRYLRKWMEWLEAEADVRYAGDEV